MATPAQLLPTLRSKVNAVWNKSTLDVHFMSGVSVDYASGTTLTDNGTISSSGNGRAEKWAPAGSGNDIALDGFASTAAAYGSGSIVCTFNTSTDPAILFSVSDQSANTYLFIGVSSSGRLIYRLVQAGSRLVAWDSSASTYSDNNTHTFAVTVGIGGTKFYVDGSDVTGTGTFSDGTTASTTFIDDLTELDRCRIGSLQFNTSSEIIGSATSYQHRVGLWSEALTAAEVKDATIQGVSVVMAGQSNGIGRNGPIDGTLDAIDNRVMQINRDAGATDEFIVAGAHPFEHSGATANTIGPVGEVANALLTNIEGTRNGYYQVCVVPVSVGGTAINTGEWQSGGTQYDDAVARTNTATAKGYPVAVIFWQQGESDANDGTAAANAYASNFTTHIATGLRGAFADDALGTTDDRPLIVGTLADEFVTTGALVPSDAAIVQAALIDTPNANTYTYLVNATGLLTDDNTHFAAADTRTLGERHYSAFQAATSTAGGSRTRTRTRSRGRRRHY